MATNIKMTLEEFQKRIDNRYPNYNFEVLQYSGQKEPMTIRCLNCGWENTYTQAQNFDRNGRKKICPGCDGANKTRLTKEEAQKRIDDIFGKNEFEILEFTKASDKLLVRHKCGYCFTKTKLFNLEKSLGCPKCKSYSSKGEQEIAKILTKWKIPFETQKKYSGLIGENSNGPLRFDFCIDNKLLIEFDGEGHYRDYKGIEGSYEQQKKNDEKKNRFCQENNIPLLRIPYWRFKDIANLLKEFFILNDYPFGEYSSSEEETLDTEK